jgi:type IV pilus assembly protein PilB
VNRERVGHQLVEAKVISSENLTTALAIQQGEGGRLGSIFVRMGVLSEPTLLEFLSQHYGVPTVELSTCSIDVQLRELFPLELVQQHLVVPIKKTATRLTLAMVDPTNSSLLDELRFRTGLHITPMVATESDIRRTIGQAYDLPQNGLSSKNGVEPEYGMVDQQAREAEKQSLSSPATFDRGMTFSPVGDSTSVSSPKLPVTIESHASAVDVVNALVQEAIEMDASDIHVEPLESIVRIRFRLDGVLRPIHNFPKTLHQSLLARLKILADLDIAERRLPQDGRMKIDGFPDIDIRVAILPCLFGEKAVLRILNQAGLALHLTNLGLNQLDLDRMTTALGNPYGMILVTGPTGSGKTTTLYSALQYLNTPHMNIVTVEDPVEFQIQGINQLQIHEEIGLSFSMGLRSFLRQDPDVMMVGEIRDRETAQIAIQASLTGHRVLSTLHTMNGPGAITRLIDMGIEPFLVSSAISLIIGIIGQRLVRKICGHCAEPDVVSPVHLRALGFEDDMVDTVHAMKGRGCERCHMTGYKGRMALFETLPIVDRLHHIILSRASTSELSTCAMQEGFRTLRQAGLVALQQGQTTVSEILTETSDGRSPETIARGV